MKQLIPAVLLLTCAVNAFAGLKPPVPMYAAMTPAVADFIVNKPDDATEVIRISVPMPLYSAAPTPGAGGGDLSLMDRLAEANKAPVISYLTGVKAIHATVKGSPEILALLTRRQVKFLSGFPGVSLLTMPAVDDAEPR